MQDLPFGEKSITLSSKEVIKVPNVVHLLIPDSIVKLYGACTNECAFTPLSRVVYVQLQSASHFRDSITSAQQVINNSL